MTGIVVGVDGAAEGCSALKRAIEEAHVRGATVRALHAWCIPHADLRPLSQLERSEQAADARLRAEIAAVGADDVPIEEVVELGKVIVAANRVAELVVVGSRGSSSLAALVPGSVSASLIPQGGCPVEVVPGRAQDA